MRERRPARPPPLRLLPGLRRALRRAGRRRPAGARDQADRVPDQRRLDARAGADPRRRARQAGGLPGRAAGALRRAHQHPLGEGARAGRRARRLRRTRRSRRTRSACSSSAARATACATTSTSAPATTTRRRPACTPTSGCFTTDEAIGADVAELFNFLTGFGRPSGFRKVLVAPSYLRNAILDEIEQTIAAHSPGVAGADRDQDQRARRSRDASPRSTAPRGPACASTSTCAGSAACARACRGSRTTSASSPSSGACSSTRACTRSSGAASGRPTSPPPT